MGILPNIYDNQRIGITQEHKMNIEPVLNWLADKSASYKFFSRRYPHLLKFWVKELTSEQKQTHIPI